jgi:uncharacterized protein YbjT (DUF2867 family)
MHGLLAAARVQVALRLAVIQRPLAPLLRAHRRTALELAVSPTRCEPAWTALPVVVETQMAAVDAVVRVAVVAVVLEATQMATHSAETAAVALIAGASGLVGKELLALLLASPDCHEVHSLVRKSSTAKHPQLRSHIVDFSTLGTASAQTLALPPIDEVYVCLGTTIKAAGSQAAFRAVDFDAVLAVARIGIALGATKLGVVSAMGASAQSSVFYSRVKGEMEDAVAQLGYQSVSIARPSFLAGDREALQQATRPGEKIALRVSQWLKPLIPANYRSVQASDVAAGLLRQVRQGQPGVTVLLSAQLAS